MKLLEVKEQDGYRVSRVSEMKDSSWRLEVGDAETMVTLSQEVEELGAGWLDRIRQFYTRIGRPACVADIVERVGPKPASENHEEISFWAVIYYYVLLMHSRLSVFQGNRLDCNPFAKYRKVIVGLGSLRVALVFDLDSGVECC